MSCVSRVLSRRREDAKRRFLALRAGVRTGTPALMIGHRATEPQRTDQRASRGLLAWPRIGHACAARRTTAEGRRKLFSAALWLCDKSRHTHAPRVSNANEPQCAARTNRAKRDPSPLRLVRRATTNRAKRVDPFSVALWLCDRSRARPCPPRANRAKREDRLCFASSRPSSGRKCAARANRAKRDRSPPRLRRGRTYARARRSADFARSSRFGSDSVSSFAM
jgi:hypothetical protein